MHMCIHTLKATSTYCVTVFVFSGYIIDLETINVAMAKNALEQQLWSISVCHFYSTVKNMQK